MEKAIAEGENTEIVSRKSIFTAVCDLIYHIKNPRGCVTLRDNTPYLLWFVWSKFAVNSYRSEFGIVSRSRIVKIC